MSFIPQALASPGSRSVLFVFKDEKVFSRDWAHLVTTVDAPGVSTHPRNIKAGDEIDWFITGWNKAKVAAVEFDPDDRDIPGFHRSGCFRFTTSLGYINVRVDGREVVGPDIFVFPPTK
jgi:hypothetical protein